jgi:hypothetical protein
VYDLPENGKSPVWGPCLPDDARAEELIALVVTLLSYGCPRQAIVHAFDLDERTARTMARTSWAAVPKGS